MKKIRISRAAHDRLLAQFPGITQTATRLPGGDVEIPVDEDVFTVLNQLIENGINSSYSDAILELTSTLSTRTKQ